MRPRGCSRVRGSLVVWTLSSESWQPGKLSIRFRWGDGCEPSCRLRPCCRSRCGHRSRQFSSILVNSRQCSSMVLLQVGRPIRSPVGDLDFDLALECGELYRHLAGFRRIQGILNQRSSRQQRGVRQRSGQRRLWPQSQRSRANAADSPVPPSTSPRQRRGVRNDRHFAVTLLQLQIDSDERVLAP